MSDSPEIVENSEPRPERPLPVPTVEYLLSCSKDMLYTLELSALNQSAEHLKAARLELEEAVAQREASGVVRWMIEHREELLEQTNRTVEVRAVPGTPSQVNISGPKMGLDALLGRKPKGGQK